jgi:hypothetical protein
MPLFFDILISEISLWIVHFLQVKSKIAIELQSTYAPKAAFKAYAPIT